MSSRPKNRLEDRARPLLHLIKFKGSQLVNARWGIPSTDERFRWAKKKGFVRFHREGGGTHRCTVALLTEAGMDFLESSTTNWINVRVKKRKKRR